MNGNGGVDGIALTALRTALGLPGVVRAGLGLTVVGGRQLRFLPSDRNRLDAADWCLIDSFDRLPLNDAVRTGRPVVIESPHAMALRYPELAEQQSGGPVRSLVALPLGENGTRLGGLLLYVDHDIVAPSEEQQALAATVAAQLVALRAYRSGSSHPGTHRLPSDATAPGRARDLLRQAVVQADISDDTLDSALLCLSELVTNVVMHADRAPAMDVELTPSSLTVRLHHDATGPEPRSPLSAVDPLRISGRGLELVDALATTWGSESTDVGTTTWFRLDL